MKLILTLLASVVFSTFIHAQTMLKFEKVKSMKTPSYNFGYAASNQDLYAMGGTQGMMEFGSGMQVYDSRTGKWITVKLKDIPYTTTTSLLYLEEYDGLLMLGGSQLVGDAESLMQEARVIDLSNLTIKSLGNFPNAAKKMGLAKQGDFIYYFGGYLSKSRFSPPTYTFSNHFYSFNLKSGALQELANLPMAMSTQGGIYDGNLYLFGGFDDRYLSEIWQFDFETQVWKELKGFKEPVSSYALAQYEHYFILVGDYSSGDQILVYDAKKQEYKTFQSNVRMRNGGAAILNGYLYVFGGQLPYPGKEQLQQTYRISVSELIDEMN